MPRNICHLVIVFGHKNQAYTTELLELLNSNFRDRHYVFCHKAAKTSDKIEIFEIRPYGYLKFLFLLLKHYISDEAFRSLKAELTIRELYKWIGLIEELPDILHVHHAHGISIPILTYLKQKKVKLIFSLRGRDLLVNTEIINELQKLKLKLSFADKVHNISFFMKRYLKDKLNIDSDVIYRGQQLAKGSNKKSSQVKGNSIAILAVGRLEWEKGHVYLIECIHRLTKKGFNIKLDIYGDGSLMESLNYRIKQLGLQDSITLMGNMRNDLLKMQYKNYNLAIQPSLTEALSNGLIDFMLHDLPCVITNVGGMVEVIEDNINGIVIDKTKLDSMGEAIINVFNLDFEKLKEFNKTHREKFTRKYELKGYFNMYEYL